MNKDIIVEKIKYLTSMPHSSLVEHCIYLENENDNYKAQKYITDFISENGIICEKNKKIEQLQQKIDKATEYIQNHQPVFQLNTKEQLEEMYYDFYKNILEILGEKENE